MQIDHFIVAPSNIAQDGLKYRRHRLLDKLEADPMTKTIYWICPARSTGNLKLLLNGTGFNQKRHHSKIIEITIDDYKNIANLQKGVHRKIFKKIFPGFDKGARKILWYTYPGFSDLAQITAWDKVIYDCSDFWGSSWIKLRGIKRIKPFIFKLMFKESEKRIAKNSDILFSTSQFLSEKLTAITGESAIVIENGVDFPEFHKSINDKMNHIPFPRIGFVGGIKNKLDFDLLYQLAITNPLVNLVLVGPKPEEKNYNLDRLLALLNVHEVGGVNYEDVPNYMKSMEVGILPYKKIAYNKAVSPLKMFEYLATGTPVVGIGVPTTQKYHQPGVYIYTANPEDFINECINAIKLRNEEDLIEQRIQAAKNHDWEEKFTKMLTIVKESLSH